MTICGEKDADTKKRVSTVSFLVKGKKSQDVVEAVDKLSKGLMGIRWGGFYSNRLMEEVLGLGKDGVVRVSMVHYNTCKLTIPKVRYFSADENIVDEVKQLLGYFDQVLGPA